MESLPPGPGVVDFLLKARLSLKVFQTRTASQLRFVDLPEQIFSNLSGYAISSYFTKASPSGVRRQAKY